MLIRKVEITRAMIDRTARTLEDQFDAMPGMFGSEAQAQNIIRDVLSLAFPDAKITVEVAKEPDSPPPQVFVY